MSHSVGDIYSANKAVEGYIKTECEENLHDDKSFVDANRSEPFTERSLFNENNNTIEETKMILNKIHNNGFKCTFCEGRFPNRLLLVKHLMIVCQNIISI